MIGKLLYLSKRFICIFYCSDNKKPVLCVNKIKNKEESAILYTHAVVSYEKYKQSHIKIKNYQKHILIIMKSAKNSVFVFDIAVHSISINSTR